MSAPVKPKEAWLSQGAEVLVREIDAAATDAVHCDVLIVGSGYGGAVAAARFAGAVDATGRPIDVVVLERGRELQPGMFPAQFGEAPGHVRFSLQDGKPARGRPESLFDLRLGGDVSVLVASGLGGGSLINAAVMERARPEIFARGWPRGIDADALEPAYGKVAAMLAPRPLPADRHPPKLVSLEKLGAAMHANETRRADVAIAFETHTSAGGVVMRPCNDCGDCVSGCNHGAKASLDANYLAYAAARGARMFCGATVRTVLPHPAGGWAVAFHFTAANKAGADPRPYVVRARRVVIAAGALGSTEILLRSKKAGLAASDRVGRNFSTNGDMIAAAYRQREAAHIVARESDAPESRGVGPTITGLARAVAADGSPIVVQEFAIPALLRRMLGEVVTTAGLLHGLEKMDWSRHRAPGTSVDDPLAVTDDAIEHTAIYGIMGNDGAAGTVELEKEAKDAKGDAAVRIVWPRVGAHPVFDTAFRKLEHAHASEGDLGGRVLPNPLWRFLPDALRGALDMADGPVTTVHPLGGCPMGDSGATGAVDAHGRVFRGAGAEVHPDLVVLDGSIVPTALAINPAMTIAALAERAAPVLLDAWEWTLPDTVAARHDPPPRPLRAPPAVPVTPARTSVTLAEQLDGEVTIRGRRYFAILTVRFGVIEDVAAFLQREPRRVRGCRAELRLYDPAAGRDLCRARGSSVRPLHRFDLEGEVAILERAESGLIGRLWRVYRSVRSGVSGSLGWLDRIRLASNIGERRTLDYDFRVATGSTGGPVAVGERLFARKTLEIGEETNPWRQLTHVEARLGPAGREQPIGGLDVDFGYFAREKVALFEIVEQRDQPNALADLVAFVLQAIRLVIKLHLPAFRTPDDQRSHTGPEDRLPQRLAGIDGFDFEDLAIPGRGATKIRLTRYRTGDARTDRPPVLLVHGFGASGSTFAHPSIGRNLVHYLALDLRRDVWVVDLRTSIGLEQRRGDWTFEGIAREDLPLALARIVERTGAPKVDVVAHCIGSAMLASVLLEPSGEAAIAAARERVGAIVLSQVAPLLELSPMNRFRGYVMSYLKAYLMADELDVRPAAGADAGSRLMPIVDAVLASYPYPADDREWERVRPEEDFRRVRHRADAIFGQLMELANVGAPTLAALDAIYGWVNVDTLAQTIHFAERRMVTDAEGSNRIVARGSLHEHFARPVMLLHGRRNAVFDWRGAWRALGLLAGLFDRAGWPRDADPATAGEAIAGGRRYALASGHELVLLDRYGHQDCLIGEHAHRDVFPYIGAFLERSVATSRPRVAALRPQVIVDVPWMGPALGWLRCKPEARGRYELRLLVHPNPRRASTDGVVIVPVRRRHRRWVPVLSAAGWLGGDGAAWRDRLLNQAIALEVDPLALDGYAGLLVLTVHEIDAAADAPGARRSRRPVFPELEPLGPALARAVVRFAWRTPGAAHRLAPGIVPLTPRVLAAADRSASPGTWPRPAPTLTFALASCLYPRGLLDEAPAGRVLERLAARLDEPRAPQFLLLVGDQVYLDSTAGVFEPRSGPTQVVRAYEQNFRLAPFRAIARRIPTYAVLDDHEIADNWEPDMAIAGSRQAADALVKAAREAYLQHQRKLSPPTERSGVERYWYTMQPGGLPFFVLDTRTQRERRALRPDTPGPAARLVEDARIVPEDVLARLQAWLVSAPADQPKLVVSPSVVFPFDRAALGSALPERIALDGWCGYPASLGALLGFIRDEAIRNVVFLSGDLHLSMATRMTLRGRRGPVVVHSIVSSGLYAPWPFANAQPDDFHRDGPFALDVGRDVLSGEVETPLLTTENAYAELRLADTGRGWRLEVGFSTAGGTLRESFDLAPSP